MGAHVYIVGMGVTAFMIFTGLLCTSPSEHTTSAFFMQAAWSGVSCSEIHTAFPSVHRFCSATRMSSRFKGKKTSSHTSSKQRIVVTNVHCVTSCLFQLQASPMIIQMLNSYSNPQNTQIPNIILHKNKTLF